MKTNISLKVMKNGDKGWGKIHDKDYWIGHRSFFPSGYHHSGHLEWFKDGTCIIPKTSADKIKNKYGDTE